MKLQNLEVKELSSKEKIKTEGGFMVPVSWIVSASVAVSGFVEDAKAAYKLLTE